MSKPGVTVGIPFKNPGPYFALALQSVFAQTFTDWELLLMDDGSTDRPAAVVAAVPGDRQGSRTPIIHKRGYQTPR